MLLFNPISSTGTYLNNFSDNKIAEFNHPSIEKTRKTALEFLERTTNFENLVLEINHLFQSIRSGNKTTEYIKDQRIQKAIAYLEANYDRIVPLEEIAGKCFLSPSRFFIIFTNCEATHRR